MVDDETTIVDSPEALRAIRALISYARRLPIPLIQQGSGVSRSQVYRDIKRGRELLKVEQHEILPDILLLSDELIRHAWAHYEAVDGVLDEEGKPLRPLAKVGMKMGILSFLNGYLAVRVNAVKHLVGQATTITAIPTQYGAAIQLKGETLSPAQRHLQDLKIGIGSAQ